MTSKQSWFVRIDLPKFEPLPSWFTKWCQDFGPEFEFLPYFIKKKYEIFAEKLSSKLLDPFVQFIIYFHILWILSWQYGLSYKNSIPVLVHKLFIHWWDKFNASIKLDSVSSILTKSVSIFTQRELPLRMSASVSTAFPPMLS